MAEHAFWGQISGTYEADWWGGELEGVRGHIRGVLRLHTPDSSTATFAPTDETDIKHEQIAVPIVYLAPLPPEGPKEKVVALDGNYKGRVVVVREWAEDKCVVSFDGIIFDMETDKLARLYSHE